LAWRPGDNAVDVTGQAVEVFDEVARDRIRAAYYGVTELRKGTAQYIQAWK